MRVVHLPAGPEGIEGRRELYSHLREFEASCWRSSARRAIDYDVIHSHYWLSGLAGASVCANAGALRSSSMFHTLGEVKKRANGGSNEPDCPHRSRATRREGGRRHRLRQRAREAACSSSIYGAPAERIAVVPCGVDLDRFRPIDKEMARERRSA